MKKLLKSALAFVIVAAAVALVSSNLADKSSGPKFTPAPSSDLSLVTEPQDGMKPELDLINGAKKSVDLVMYELEDSQIEQALVAAQARGVSVRVLLNEGYNGEQDKTNEPAYDYLSAHNVPVRWTPSYFALTHQKTLVVDNKEASIMTFNFTPQYYATSRDFAINDTDSKDVAAVVASFDSDWYSERLTAGNGDDLIWSPGSESAMVDLINSAKKSVDIYNEEMDDSSVESALESAAGRGVNVEVVMTYSSSWKSAFTQLKDAGVHVRTYAASAPTYIHAKMILADGSKAFVGSENFSTTSLDKNRELGIELSDPSIINSLQATFNADYQNATAF